MYWAWRFGAEEDFTVLSVPDGSTVEVFGHTSSYNHHLTHPVVGFLVEDLEGARIDLEQVGRSESRPTRRQRRGRTDAPGTHR
ncbi:MAG: hypothetical protein M3256_14345 [Actinomycetota bacterium]|nr:hypothetical protein [Actinomycetota bacterium]